MKDSVQSPRLPVRVPLVNEPWGIWKSLQMARANILRIIPEIATTQPMVSGRTGKRWHMVMDPGAIRHMLLDKLDDYPKSLVTKNLLKPAIGESMFIAEGAHWRWQRRTAAPVFSHRNMMNLSPIMTQAAERAVDRVTEAGPKAVNFLDEMVTTTFDVIADVTFSGGDAFDRDAVHGAIDDYIAEVAPYTDYLHIADAVGVSGEGVQIGSGDGQFNKIVDSLSRHCQGVPFIPEIWQGHHDGGQPFYDAFCELKSCGLD